MIYIEFFLLKLNKNHQFPFQKVYETFIQYETLLYIQINNKFIHSQILSPIFISIFYFTALLVKLYLQ